MGSTPVRLRPRSESSATEGAAGEGAGAAAGWRDTPRQDGESGPLQEMGPAPAGEPAPPPRSPTDPRLDLRPWGELG